MYGSKSATDCVQHGHIHKFRLTVTSGNPYTNQLFTVASTSHKKENADRLYLALTSPTAKAPIALAVNDHGAIGRKRRTRWTSRGSARTSEKGKPVSLTVSQSDRSIHRFLLALFRYELCTDLAVAIVLSLLIRNSSTSKMA